MIKNTLSFLAKSLAIFFTLLTIILVGISLIRPEWIKVGIDWIGNLIQSIGNWNYLVAFLSACIESLPIVGTAVPGMNIMILVGGFWGKEHIFLTILLAALGAMLGNYTGYWIGKYYGKELIAKYGDWFGVGITEAKILEKQIEKNGFWYIVLGKFHNLTRSFIPFIAGGSGMLEKNFWLYNMIGSCLWAVSVNLLGIFFIQNYEAILDNVGKIMLGGLILFFGYIYFFQKEKFLQYMKDKQAEIEAKSKR
ncbi:DedA family protein [Candidatus Gracilibacteria bacterium]|nr:DedA family protein [Candidatus Gracilibacteria bacterium]